MRRVSFLIAAMVLYQICGGRAWAQQTSVLEDNAILNSFAKAKESGRARDIEILQTVLKRVKEQGHVSIQDNWSIEQTIGRLIEDEVLGLTAAQRQELVKKKIGEADYSTLEQAFLKQLGSSDGDQQRSALRSLGYPLFALGATDQIKALVFRSDRMPQYLAVKSLVYLDVPGASSLLKDMIRASALKDHELSKAIDALYISNDKGLDQLSMALLEMEPGGMTFQSLLPVLKKRSDFREVIGRVFKSNMFSVPDKEGLPMEQQWKAVAEHDLLSEIIPDPKPFMADEEIKKKVLMYASTNYNGLYTLALVILEKSGQELGYFTEMLKKDGQLPVEKKRVLEKIVSRMQKGERLK